MNNKRSIRTIISVSDREDQYIMEQAKKCGLSKSGFIREMALSGQVVNSLPEAKLRSTVAQLYNLAEQIEDVSIRDQIKKGADNLWRSLK